MWVRLSLESLGGYVVLMKWRARTIRTRTRSSQIVALIKSLFDHHHFLHSDEIKMSVEVYEFNGIEEIQFLWCRRLKYFGPLQEHIPSYGRSFQAPALNPVK